MGVDRAVAEEETLGDLPGAQSRGGQIGDLPFALAQRGPEVRDPGARARMGAQGRPSVGGEAGADAFGFLHGQGRPAGAGHGLGPGQNVQCGARTAYQRGRRCRGDERPRMLHGQASTTEGLRRPLEQLQRPGVLPARRPKLGAGPVDARPLQRQTEPAGVRLRVGEQPLGAHGVTAGQRGGRHQGEERGPEGGLHLRQAITAAAVPQCPQAAGGVPAEQLCVRQQADRGSGPPAPAESYDIHRPRRERDRLAGVPPPPGPDQRHGAHRRRQRHHVGRADRAGQLLRLGGPALRPVEPAGPLVDHGQAQQLVGADVLLRPAGRGIQTPLEVAAGVREPLQVQLRAAEEGEDVRGMAGHPVRQRVHQSGAAGHFGRSPRDVAGEHVAEGDEDAQGRRGRGPGLGPRPGGLPQQRPDPVVGAAQDVHQPVLVDQLGGLGGQYGGQRPGQQRHPGAGDGLRLLVAAQQPLRVGADRVRPQQQPRGQPRAAVVGPPGGPGVSRPGAALGEQVMGEGAGLPDVSGGDERPAVRELPGRPLLDLAATGGQCVQGEPQPAGRDRGCPGDRLRGPFGEDASRGGPIGVH
nr:putative transcriptional regulator [Streptomyces sp. KCTC 0041BP]